MSTNNANETYREVLDFSVSPYHLFHADCLEKMKEIPDNSIDLILCDPPYRNCERCVSERLGR